MSKCEYFSCTFVLFVAKKWQKSGKKKPRTTARPLSFIAIVRLLYNVDFDNAFVNLYEVGSVCEVASVDSLVRSSIFDACYNLTE